MTYNDVLISGIQQRESVIHNVYIYPLLFRFFSHLGHYRILSRNCFERSTFWSFRLRIAQGQRDDIWGSLFTHEFSEFFFFFFFAVGRYIFLDLIMTHAKCSSCQSLALGLILCHQSTSLDPIIWLKILEEMWTLEVVSSTTN